MRRLPEVLLGLVNFVSWGWEGVVDFVGFGALVGLRRFPTPLGLLSSRSVSDILERAKALCDCLVAISSMLSK